MKKHSYLATAARGTEKLLAEELDEIGAEDIRIQRGLVQFRGDVETGWRANLWSRIANRILRPLAELDAYDGDTLYESVKAIRWDEHLSTSHTFAVEANVKDNPNLTHSHFVELRIKDAIVDRFRDQYGQRPSVNPKEPDVRVIAYIDRDRCALSLDMSGDPLFKRGYRVRPTAAPLKETLAAALVLSTSYGGRRPFADPMCGSGTIVIEAALIATGRAPGRNRTFAFQKWPNWSQANVKRWREILSEADEESRARAPGRIVAYDVENEAVAAAQANSQEAKVYSSIEFARRELRSFLPMNPPGILVMNPPYGERIGARGEDIPSLYRGIAAKAKELPGHEVWVFVAKEPELLEALGEPEESLTFWNGAIECAFMRLPTA